MKRWSSWVCGGLTACFSIALAAEVATIHLHDGSKLRGEVLSLKGGAYEISSATLGKIKISQQDVRIVEYGATAGQPAAPDTTSTLPANAPAMLSGLQSKMLSDPNIVKMIQSLQNDPELMAIVNDSEIQAAIASGDFNRLLNHPKFIQLMDNDKIKSITKKVQ